MANKVYLVRETPIEFRTGSDVSFSIASLGNGLGFRSARVDLGSGSRPYKFEWRANFTISTTVSSVTGAETFDLFVCSSDGTRADGGLATTEGSISSDDTRFNLKHIGSVIVDSNSGTSFLGSGKFELTSRYYSLVLFNFTGVALSATQSTTVNTVFVTPLVEEIQ